MVVGAITFLIVLVFFAVFAIQRVNAISRIRREVLEEVTKKGVEYGRDVLFALHLNLDDAPSYERMLLWWYLSTKEVEERYRNAVMAKLDYYVEKYGIKKKKVVKKKVVKKKVVKKRKPAVRSRW